MDSLPVAFLGTWTMTDDQPKLFTVSNGPRNEESSGAQARFPAQNNPIVYRGSFQPLIHLNLRDHLTQSFHWQTANKEIRCHRAPAYAPFSSNPSATCISCTLSHATPLSTLPGPSDLTASSSAGLLTSKSPAKPSALTPSGSRVTASWCVSRSRGKTYMCPSVSTTLYDGGPTG